MNESYNKKDLWENASAPLVFLLPGGTGTKRPEMKGFDAMAAMFWLKGYSAYVFATSGQDGLPGEYCMQNFLREAQATLQALVAKLNPSCIVLFGSCAGGAIAGHLAARTDRSAILALWESPLHYTDSDVAVFVERTGQSMPLAGNFTKTLVHLDSVIGQIKCPVLIVYGPPVPPKSAVFRHEDILKTESSLKLLQPHQVEKIFLPGTDHNLTRGTDVKSLKFLVGAVCGFVRRHRS